MGKLDVDKIRRSFEQRISNRVEANGESLEEKWKYIEKTVIRATKIPKPEGQNGSKKSVKQKTERRLE